MNEIQDIGSGTYASGSHVYRSASVQQLDRNDNVIRSYTLVDAWPTTLDAIDLAYDTNDVVEEFGATFRFNYMTVNATTGASGRFGGRSIGTTGTQGPLPPLTSGSSSQVMDTDETYFDYE